VKKTIPPYTRIHNIIPPICKTEPKLAKNNIALVARQNNNIAPSARLNKESRTPNL
jgi:hypothetical protein